MSDMEKVIEGLENLRETIRTATKYTFTSGGICAMSMKRIDNAIALLKEQEAVVPYMDFDGHDVWRCGKCGATIFHIYHNASDEDAKNYAKFCRHCGREVNWDA